ncbi:MAG TPA: FAD-dependent oxidoreductase [Chitinophagaceae bacterium]|nr:FAD-dependent oxidoreductase [Chitinophagaceae bacterium]
MNQVTIAGGGVIGLCTAYYLHQAGFQVTVVDRQTITDGCSFGNMGYISPSHFIPLATPGIISQGIRWMMRASSPFYIKPRLNLDLIRWGLAFRRSATAAQVSSHAPHLNNLLQLSRELTVDLKRDLPDSFDLQEKGCWMLYKSPRTGDHEKHLADQARAFGLKTVLCSPEQVQQYEPEVEVDVAGGVLYLDDCHLHPARFMQALYRYLQNAGVSFWVNTEITGFETSGNRITGLLTRQGRLDCGELVLASGSWLPRLSGMLGIRTLLQPGKGYSLVYDNLAKNLHYPSILVDDRTATSPIGRWLRIGGTMELSGHNDRILPSRVLAIHAAFQKYYPSLPLPKPDPAKAWFGYRPVTPDGLPYIGRHGRYVNLTYAGGHAMLGVSAAAGTGKLVSQLLAGQPTGISLEAFHPERFR